MCIRDRQEPEEGWLKGCYGHVLGYMFPEKQKDEGITPMPTVRGRPVSYTHLGLYLKTSDIRSASSVFERRQISVRGIYEIEKQNQGERKYVKVK